VLNKFLAFLGERASADLCDIEKRSIVDTSKPLRCCSERRAGMNTLTLILYTGQRLGDLAALTWANVDLVRSELHPAAFVPVLKRDSNAITRRPFTLPELRRLLEIADQEWQSLIHFGRALVEPDTLWVNDSNR
jgi:integrase